MHASILLPALFGAAAMAGDYTYMAQNDASTTSSAALAGQPTSCPAAGLDAGKNEQVVTVVHVSNDDGSQLRYFPENIEAAVGSIVQFQFHPRNHTITESSFDEPCKAIDASLASPERPGIRSGFVPVTPQDTELKVFNLLVNDTKPIWLFCGQTPHCQRGMSMVINEPKNNPDRTLAKYKEAAANVPLPAGFTPPPAPSASGSASASGSSPAASSSAVDQAQAASGTATGLPATFTGAASRQTTQYAGLAGLLLTGVFALL